MSHPPFAIVATLGGKSDLTKQARLAKKQGADVLEVRIDSLPAQALPHLASDMQQVRRLTRLPIVATIRSGKEQAPGARYLPLSDLERTALFKTTFAWADAIDIELSSVALHPLIALALRQKKQVIVSVHNFTRKFSGAELRQIAKKFQRTQASALKIAATPHTPSQTRQFLNDAAQIPGSKIIIAMGKWGAISRLAAPLFESSWSYACLENNSFAPGQISVEKLALARKVFYPES